MASNLMPERFFHQSHGPPCRQNLSPIWRLQWSHDITQKLARVPAADLAMLRRPNNSVDRACTVTERTKSSEMSLQHPAYTWR